MLQLPNNCKASALTVTPRDWKTVKSSARDWRIFYRFYDPGQTRPKMVNIKNMNRLKDVKQRKQATLELLKNEEAALLNGYNPFLKQFVRDQSTSISPRTPFTSALTAAMDRLTMAETTRKDVRNTVNNISRAAESLYFHLIPIKEIRKSHIKLILEECERKQKNFSDKTFNTYRKYLAVLFNELSDLDAVETNIIREIKKKTIVEKSRQVLTQEQRQFINGLLQEKYPAFHRFLHIFFHSGARITELLRLKVKDVDLLHQRYTTLVIKGKRRRDAQRTIKTVALTYWQDILQNANPEDYVFSRGLVPGSESIQPYQITKRWYRLVKNNKEVIKRFGSIGDFYSLKHSNTSEMVDLMGDEAAAEQNGHTTTAMVRSIYDVKRKDRMHEKLKGVSNAFV